MRDRSMVLPRATSSAPAVEAGETRGDNCNAGSRCLRECLETGREFMANVTACLGRSRDKVCSLAPVIRWTGTKLIDLRATRRRCYFVGCFALLAGSGDVMHGIVVVIVQTDTSGGSGAVMQTRSAPAASISPAHCLVSETRPTGDLDRMSPQHSRRIGEKDSGLQQGCKLVSN